jgi:hypothetical protein
MAQRLRRRVTDMIDRESESAVTIWLRLGDRVTGRQPLDGRCDHCGGSGYLSLVENRRLCARCYLDGATADS